MDKTKQDLIKCMNRKGCSQMGNDLWIAAFVMNNRGQSAIALTIIFTGLIAADCSVVWSANEVFKALE